jgi:hypothetical protein
MTKYKVHCIELNTGQELEEWIKCICIKDDANRETRITQDEAIKKIENGDIIYIDKDDLSNPESNDIELIIETNAALNKRYIHTPNLGTLYEFYHNDGDCDSRTMTLIR